MKPEQYLANAIAVPVTPYVTLGQVTIMGLAHGVGIILLIMKTKWHDGIAYCTDPGCRVYSINFLIPFLLKHGGSSTHDLFLVVTLPESILFFIVPVMLSHFCTNAWVDVKDHLYGSQKCQNMYYMCCFFVAVYLCYVIWVTQCLTDCLIFQGKGLGAAWVFNTWFRDSGQL